MTTDKPSAGELADKIAEIPIGPFAILLGMNDDLHFKEIVAARAMIVASLRSAPVGEETTQEIVHRKLRSALAEAQPNHPALAPPVAERGGGGAQEASMCGEPVAWQYREKIPSGGWGVWRHCDIVREDPDLNYRPLYLGSAPTPETGDGSETIGGGK